MLLRQWDGSWALCWVRLFCWSHGLSSGSSIALPLGGKRSEDPTRQDRSLVADLQAVVSQLKDHGLGVLITDHNVRETLNITEFAIIVASAGTFGGVTAEELRGKNRRHPPLAYLTNGLVFLYTALAFSLTNDWEPVHEYPVMAFLLGFSVGGIATYITAETDE